MQRTITSSLMLLVPLALITAAGARAQNGPGGVGSTDGTSHLQLWLQGSSGTYQTSAGTTAAAANGDTVGRWEDRSGRGRNVTQATAGRRPTLRTGTNGLNGLPVLAFDIAVSGGEDFLRSASISPALSQPFTLFAVARKIGGGSTAQTIVDSRTAGSNTMVLGYSGTTLARVNAATDVTVAVTQGSFTILRGVYNGTASSIAADGGTPGTGDAGARTADGFTIGANRSSTQFLGGEIAEIIHYDTLLLAAQQAIVENALSARYGIAIANDLYASTTHTTDVAGIGRESDGAHTAAASSGLIVLANGALDGNGNYLLFGHDGATTADVAADLPADMVTRWSRVWYLDKTGQLGGGNARLEFDFGDAGLATTPAGSASDYRLLRRAAASGPFAAVATVDAWISGDQVIFDVADADLQDGFYTLGLASQESALPVELVSFQASVATDGVELTWRTASERNNAGYLLWRRAADTGELAPIASYRSDGELAGLGTSAIGRSYRFLDRDRLAAGTDYEYRLQSVAADGSIDPVDFRCRVAMPSGQEPTPETRGQEARTDGEPGIGGSAPDPCSGRTVITFTLSAPEELRLAVTDRLGRLVASHAIAGRAGENRFELDLTGASPGVYFYRLGAARSWPAGMPPARTLVVVR